MKEGAIPTFFCRVTFWAALVSVQSCEAGAPEVMGEDAVKCAAPCAHGCGSDLAESDAVSPSGSVQDESDGDRGRMSLGVHMSVNSMTSVHRAANRIGPGRDGL